MNQLTPRTLFRAFVMISFCLTTYQPLRGMDYTLGNCLEDLFLCGQKYVQRPPLVDAIETDDIDATIKIITDNPNAVHQHYNGYTPIEYALYKKCPEIFAYLLAQGACIRMDTTNILLSSAWLGDRLSYFKMIIASGKVLETQRIHTNSFRWPVSRYCATLVQWPDYYFTHDTQPDILDNVWEKVIESSWHNSYTPQELDEITLLLAYISTDKESLFKKLFDTRRCNISEPLQEWYDKNCPPTDMAKKFLTLLFCCCALSKEFEQMIKNDIITVKDLTQLSLKNFEHALIARNTHNITLVLDKLIDTQDYTEAKKPLHFFNTALNNHIYIGEPYAREINDIKKQLQKKRNDRLGRMLYILRHKPYADLTVVFK